jgi:two-component system, NtrC family, response regulator GlrR
MAKPGYILLVDDDPQVLRYLTIALEEAGYAVTATTSGEAAIAYIQARRPDLLILDLNMPKPDGFELLRVEHERLPDLRILVISGYLHGGLLEAARLFGAAAILEKPVTAEALVAKVRQVLGR